MNVTSRMVLAFDTDYRQLGPNGRKCAVCRKVLCNGERVHIEKRIETKYYPVKGLMGFPKFSFWHVQCREAPT